MLVQLTVAISALAARALAAPANNMVLHQQRNHQIQAGVQRGAKVQDNAMLPIKIGLEQRNLDKGYDYLMDISDPLSPNFSEHWTAEKVEETFAPSEQSTRAVMEWLTSSGIAAERITAHDNKGWLSISMSVPEAEKLFGTEYHEYTSTDGSMRVGTDEYSLPKHISEQVDYIRPGVELSAPMKKSKAQHLSGPSVEKRNTPPPPTKSGGVASCGETTTPQCIRDLYNIPNATHHDDGNAVGIYETSDNIFSQDDMNAFYKYYAPEIPNGQSPTVHLVGDAAYVNINQSQAGLEANMDLTMIYSLTYPQEVVYYQVAEEDNFLENWLDSLDGSFCAREQHNNGTQCGTFTPEKVMSVSWGGGEGYYTVQYQHRACNEFLKLSLQGHTFVISSGDGGVGDRYSPCLGKDQNVFNPSFPATCPYTLAIGATMLTDGQSASDAETPMNNPSSAGSSGGIFSSAGGFSNFFFTAGYQIAAVTRYFENHDPGYKSYYSFNNPDRIGKNGGVYNRGGRGVPDISANGAHFPVPYRGGWFPVARMAGTSLSAPLVASMISMVNSERTAMGRRPVGFMQPVLYSHPEIFNDIVGGLPNGGCNSTGFTAVEGWDPVTGLGTMDYERLLEVYLRLP